VSAISEIREDSPHDTAERREPAGRGVAPAVRWAWDSTKLLVIVIGLFLVIRTFAMEAFRIPTGSMENTLLAGDHLLVNKVIYGPRMPLSTRRLPSLAAPRRGDVIVFMPPHDPERNYVKRLVAVGGDTVAMRGKKLLVNGRHVTEPYARYDDPQDLRTASMDWQCPFTVPAGDCVPTRDNWGPIVVPERSYLVLGDNRDDSEDSRYWGFVDRDAVKGRPIFIYLSFDPSAAGIVPWVTAHRWRRIGRLIR
jgi:signal peptidase I